MIILLLLLVLLLCLFVRREYFESASTMDYRIDDIFGIDSGKGIYRNFDPQGFSVGKDHVYIAAYHIYGSKDCPDGAYCSDGSVSTKPSKVFKINKNTKTIDKVYTLDDQKLRSHVSALHVFEDTNQLFVGYYSIDHKQKGMGIYDITEANKSSKKDVSIKTTNIVKDLDKDCLGSAGAPTYISMDVKNKKMWYGQFIENGVGNICAKELTLENNKYKLGKNIDSDKFKPPSTIKNAQGLATKDNIFYIGSSYGCSDQSKIYTYDKDTKKKINAVSGVCGLQEIDFDEDGKLWGTTESGSKYYRDTLGWPHYKGYIYEDINTKTQPSCPKCKCKKPTIWPFSGCNIKCGKKCKGQGCCK